MSNIPKTGKQTSQEDASRFPNYREGNTTSEIRFTIYMVLAARRWRGLLDEHLRRINQSSARMEAMAAIMNAPEPKAQVNIARRLRIEGPTLTRMLDTLEKDGLVKRLPDPRDRRTKQLRLTEKGEAALEDILGIADDLRMRLLQGYSEEQVEMFNTFFEEILDRLDHGLPAIER
ncbi:MarR family transcriptional regulator [Altericroceibacterium spongiae]|uniref:MarR family transcriptional regulator n=1 Tax=Altericroceibacterium spongiae TaxID=2320269 RepID=A0A420EPG2_9SPHN|nr:MarR family transcriptional regulator [Altericroceibacterium spongiae]RKF22557.1 MarR family transcriptional regulator [Altericroceibacterium spongiae]